jgi:hypothetical protein
MSIMYVYIFVFVLSSILASQKKPHALITAGKMGIGRF